jgi:hypothetical protein
VAKNCLVRDLSWRYKFSISLSVRPSHSDERALDEQSWDLHIIAPFADQALRSISCHAYSVRVYTEACEGISHCFPCSAILFYHQSTIHVIPSQVTTSATMDDPRLSAILAWTSIFIPKSSSFIFLLPMTTHHTLSWHVSSKTGESGYLSRSTPPPGSACPTH